MRRVVGSAPSTCPGTRNAYLAACEGSGERGEASAQNVLGDWRTLQLREVHNVRRTEAVHKGVNLDNLPARDRQRAARSCMINAAYEGTHCA